MQSVFWRVFGVVMTIALVVLFALPAALTISSYRREVQGGQLDSLATFLVLRITSLNAWLATCTALSGLLAMATYLFFLATLQHSNALVPTLSLLLTGINMGPLASLLGHVVRKPDTLVVAVPSLTFILLLPGLLYCNLAFDVSRTFLFELLLCCNPVTSSALVLGLLFRGEAVGMRVSWTSRSPTADMPVLLCVLVQLLDFMLLHALASLLIDYMQKRRIHTTSTGSDDARQYGMFVYTQQLVTWLLGYHHDVVFLSSLSGTRSPASPHTHAEGSQAAMTIRGVYK
ncbi:hypothetical protein EON64_19400, partial [archaeon]